MQKKQTQEPRLKILRYRTVPRQEVSCLPNSHLISEERNLEMLAGTLLQLGLHVVRTGTMERSTTVTCRSIFRFAAQIYRSRSQAPLLRERGNTYSCHLGLMRCRTLRRVSTLFTRRSRRA
jgi:hypothetical protein